jgi:quinol monooxygenase YgiN
MHATALGIGRPRAPRGDDQVADKQRADRIDELRQRLTRELGVLAHDRRIAAAGRELRRLELHAKRVEQRVGDSQGSGADDASQRQRGLLTEQCPAGGEDAQCGRGGARRCYTAWRPTCEGQAMIVVRFKVQCQAGKADELMAAFKDVVAPSEKVDGVIHFDIGCDVTDPNAFIATEVFEDRAALDRQEELAEVGKVLAMLPDVLAAPPEATIFHVSSSEPYGD